MDGRCGPERCGKPYLSGDDLSTSVLAILARYVSPAVNLQRSNIVIEGQRLTYEISAESWFVNFALSNGFTLTALTVQTPRSLDALYVEVEKDRTFVVYARVIINGSDLVLIRYYLPQENFETEKVTQAQIMASFRLLKSSDAPIEPQETYGFLDQSYFNYPKSWELKEKSIFSVERMSATLLQARKENKQSYLEGRIRVEAVSKLLKTDMAKEIARFRNDLKINSYKLGALIETVDYKYDSSMKYGKTQIYALEPEDKINMQPYELLVAAMEGDDYYYIVSLITPSRAQEYFTWARNTETVRVVIESLRRYDMPKIDPNDPYYDYLKE